MFIWPFYCILFRHVINYYLPSFLFVAVSWISFIIPIENVPGRMALLVTLILVLVNMFLHSMEAQPRSIISMVSLWIVFCIFFILAAFAAYGALLYMYVNDSSVSPSSDSIKSLTTTLKSLKAISLQKKDRIYLMTFPLSFLLFNVSYWTIIYLARKFT